jgi:hypothetical protein
VIPRSLTDRLFGIIDPTICATAFQSFLCKYLAPNVSILEADDTTLCEDLEVYQGLSVLVIIVFALGVPILLLYTLTIKSRAYERDDKAADLAVAAKVSKDLDVSLDSAEMMLRNQAIGEDFSFVMDAYDPKYMFWEAIDMLRKLALIGVVLMAGRGSTAQLNAALLMAFFFFAVQVKINPYRHRQDNWLRALTELHVFIIVLVAITMIKTDTSRERVSAQAYNVILFVTFVAFVPAAFMVAVFTKMRFMKSSLTDEASPRSAFDRVWAGVGGSEATEELKAFINETRIAVAGSAYASVLEGKTWRDAHPQVSASEVVKVAEVDFEDAEPNGTLPEDVPPVRSAPALAPSADGTSNADTYYTKYEQGFTGSFADMSDYRGGLEKMIGQCRKDIMQAMEDEHTLVSEGYGASDEMFVTSSYRVKTTPRVEWEFVICEEDMQLSAGFDREDNKDRGFRTNFPPRRLLDEASVLITASFKEKGIDRVVTAAEIKSINLMLEEIIALRLYTGPMFELYNTALRAWGNADARGIVPPYGLVCPGMDVRGSFVTTLHVLNSGVLKLATVQPALTVYRGISAMKLPDSFIHPNEDNIRGGVEYAFMSTTSDENVALTFAKDANRETASTLVVAELGMVDSGASLDWLSQ